MRKYLVVALLVGIFVLESIFVELLPAEIFNSNRILIPHFLLIGIIFLAVFGNRNIGILYGFVFGILFDIIYTEILGIYFFMFPFVVYICSKIMKVFHNNIVVVSIVSLIGISMLEIIVYEMILIIHLTSMDFSSFLNLRLFPTLILNAAFLVIVAYPFKRFFEKYAAERREQP
ncbi:rod shape-determining protein MreD [Niallia nealsonii]|uniref:Rod shape-determining protein MreD n=1 Tax=Niallia nealsonii TaxID=115979 RepID=A0A2N0YWQ8_9BACI|nr:rod shape-determining protein MreD [Niallia nealsonii]PKG21697.1 rod shape-determining protein MreD [Niallia nealsonii]